MIITIITRRSIIIRWTARREMVIVTVVRR
jgi:hypothetical protein